MHENFFVNSENPFSKLCKCVHLAIFCNVFFCCNSLSYAVIATMSVEPAAVRIGQFDHIPQFFMEHSQRFFVDQCSKLEKFTVNL